MKALNNKEIIRRYLAFIGYFSLLLFFTILCIYLFFKTNEAYSDSLVKKKIELEFLAQKKASVSAKIDSLNTLMKMLNTGQVSNEPALERAIIKIKKEALKDLSSLEESSDDSFVLEKKILSGVEWTLDLKKEVDQAQLAEKTQRKKLLECIDANAKALKVLSTPSIK